MRDCLFLVVIMIKEAHYMKKRLLQFPLNEVDFNNLYKLYYSKLCKYAWYLVNNTDLAEEIVQDFFTKLWHKQQQLKNIQSIESYFFQSVKNAAFTAYTRQQKENNEKEELKKTQTIENNTLFDEAFFLQKLEQAIILLPKKTRIIYCLKYKEGLSYDEIAQYLKISERTVETHLYRALKKLRLKLQPFKDNFYKNASA